MGSKSVNVKYARKHDCAGFEQSELIRSLPLEGRMGGVGSFASAGFYEGFVFHYAG